MFQVISAGQYNLPMRRLWTFVSDTHWCHVNSLITVWDDCACWTWPLSHQTGTRTTICSTVTLAFHIHAVTLHSRAVTTSLLRLLHLRRAVTTSYRPASCSYHSIVMILTRRYQPFNIIVLQSVCDIQSVILGCTCYMSQIISHILHKLIIPVNIIEASVLSAILDVVTAIWV